MDNENNISINGDSCEYDLFLLLYNSFHTHRVSTTSDFG